MTCAYAPYAVVRLRPHHPDYERFRNVTGTIVMTLDPVDCVYEVEFADEDGRTIDMLALSARDIELAEEQP